MKKGRSGDRLIIRNFDLMKNAKFCRSHEIWSSGPQSLKTLRKILIGFHRLDFNNFVLNAPTLAGACTTDNFKITSASSSGTLVPPVPGSLCGTNTGQHSKLKNSKKKINCWFYWIAFWFTFSLYMHGEKIEAIFP
jgi:hypothetical protein